MVKHKASLVNKSRVLQFDSEFGEPESKSGEKQCRLGRQTKTSRVKLTASSVKAVKKQDCRANHESSIMKNKSSLAYK